MTRKHDEERKAGVERFVAGVEKAAGRVSPGSAIRAEAAFIASVVQERGGAPSKRDVFLLRAMHARGLTAKQAASRLNQGLA